MDFSSIPVYLDPPNWQQQTLRVADNPQLPPPPPPPQSGENINIGSIRPGSMTDRSRQAKIPQPEGTLKCPRCESTNTKFCYFNNYNSTQPRHFCKTCRRYWTRGGALRNVPVGGGCRRNKRSKGSSRSKSPATENKTTSISSSTTSTVSSSSCSSHLVDHLTPSQPSQLHFLPPLHHLSDYGHGNIGLNFGATQPPVGATSGSRRANVGIQIGTNSSGGVNGSGVPVLSSGIAEQWRFQQFPFLANVEPQPPTGLYTFGCNENGKPFESGVGSVKVEGDDQGVNLSRNFLGVQGSSDQYWGGSNSWTDLAGFSSSWARHL